MIPVVILVLDSFPPVVLKSQPPARAALAALPQTMLQNDRLLHA